jgi:amino acid adenylation domain-containing protein
MENSALNGTYALSPMQAGMLFQSLYCPGKGLDIEQLLCDVADANPAALEFAWGQVWQVNEILSTGFDWLGFDQPVQRIHHDISLPWQLLDWRNLPGDPQEQLGNFLRQDRLAGFHLNQPPLMRLTLIQAKDGNTWLVWTYHHILLDGRSLPVIIQQMAEAYQGYCAGKTVILKPSRSYRDYITWLGDEDLSGAKAYWKKLLRGMQNPTPLGVGRSQPRLPDGGLEYEILKNHLSPELTNSLKKFAEQHSLTLNTLLQGAWTILLNRYSGEQEVVFGAIRTSRHSALGGQGTDDMLGLLINTIPVRIRIDPQTPVLQILKDLRAQSLQLRGSFAEHVSLAEIQKMSGLQPGNRLFESIVGFENLGFDEMLKAKHEILDKWDFELLEHIGYPLVLMAYAGKQLKISLEYCREMFDAATAQRMLGHLQMLLAGMVENPDCPVSVLPILTDAERRQLLVEWNDTQVEYPHDKCIHELFEAQAKQTPDALAVVFENQSLTYRQLNQRANQVAHHLQTLGVSPDVLVGICVERSLNMVIGLYGILKAGGTYVPLDPTYPPERLAFMLEDAEVRVLLTQEKLLPIFQQNISINAETTLLCLDRDWPQIALETTVTPARQATPTHLAYVIYTSGSTGKPKGVQICHQSVVNFLDSMAKHPGLTSDDTLLAVTTLSFDIAGLELFLPLSVGAKLVIAPREALMDGYQLDSLIRETGATLMQATPATWQLLLACGWKGKSNLRILCGGEALPHQLAEELLLRCAELWNMYGPTETTIWSTIEPVNVGRVSSSIGRPIANTQIYIVDPQLQPVPIGVVGEIHIGGVGLARAYLHHPELTAEKFIPNPFGTEPLYKTGDLGRYLPDGNIEFLGRIDHQVKIRGFRIELGEIETVLGEHPAVQKVVAVASAGATEEKRLVAYITIHDIVRQKDEIAPLLREHLRKKLPDYMIPSAFVVLEKFPLTPNGKIDRKALPDPQLFHPVGGQFVPPQTSIEKSLAGLWSEILGVENIGINDNFFDLGGHSLLATRLFVRIRDVLGLELPLRQLFEVPILAELAKQIENQVWAARQGYQPIEVGNSDQEEFTL